MVPRTYSPGHLVVSLLLSGIFMTAAPKLYDAVMRLPAVLFELYFLVRELAGIRVFVAAHPYFGGDWPFLIALAARVSVVIFIAVLAILFLSRRRPIRKYNAWRPKITALAGMLFTYLILLTPRAEADVLWNGASTLFTLLGSTMAIIAALDLGRSLSIMPEARKLVTEGLYSQIRHPLYLAEEIATIGFFLQFRSWQACLILIVHLFLQIRRMDWEEGILGREFSEYDQYKRRTWRLLPRLY